MLAQVGGECLAEVDEVFRDRLTPAQVEHPVLEYEEQRAALAGAKLDRPRGARGGEGGSICTVSRVLESTHQGVVRRPAEDDRATFQLDDDRMEKHRHEETVCGPVASAQDPNGELSARPPASVLPQTPGALLSRTHLRELGLERTPGQRGL